MSLYPYISLFSSTLFFSTLLALSSSHWLIVWASLEVNIISFIPLITISVWSNETEAAVKYFLFQALGSRLLLLSSFSPFLSFILVFAMMIKLGIAPFHFWFPSVINSVTWPLCLALSTWQKVAPLTILLSLTSPSTIFLFLASLNALIGGLGGLNQSQIRPLLAYSSIGHIGWMMAASIFSPWVRAIYFLFYLAHSTILFVYFWSYNTLSLKTLSSTTNFNPLSTLVVSFLLLSLGGLPPLIGFIPKLIAISTFTTPLMPFLLIFGSLINIFYYLNITLAAILRKNNNFFSSGTSSFFLPLFFILSSTIPILYL